MSLFEDPEIYRTVLESIQNGKFLKDHHALTFVCDSIRMAAGHRKKLEKRLPRRSSGFLGILLCYGLVGPVAARMAKGG
jgi:hypothetical protein